ncbi:MULTISPECIES: dihydrodipicolinate synthase family protein [Alteromonas]|uniref:Dihydrodipicolinate synthase family protein n=1 Tax=Alteromonas stellipolaris TaxID=233316 RepID=A0AAW7Z4N8_9ALTE|nr:MULTISPECIES: dihydrodipicolinate synthase family protein [Alteromonas]AMJ89220.1 dihydrodipicolinate synthase family protein [Alteromonas sp. Mac2]ALM92260.1 Dihydrodipicolinate synthase [Alteromonas stellipolaris LMG 21856]AMJ72941.1 dihydrodipicolinate synthase family protein [Alteromonas stellipolaris]AMJ85333.1 dihydrodipicolinate synthase family protein [Alteromonas sp. Mac1]ANB20410.1 dihydrodipicolinate synthase family protein [Alteromonas stellipolaris]
MFTGLCAFPLTPFHHEKIDFHAFEKLIGNLKQANVESICAMGSTGLYPYLSRDELVKVTESSVGIAGDTPVMVGIGSLRTYDVLKNAEAAQQAGAKALLLAPVSYHPLHDAEVFGLYEKVTAEISIPLCIYENPGVTQFSFSDELYRQVTQLPNVGAIKIPGMPFGDNNANGKIRLSSLRNIVPEHVAIGVSGDKFGALGMHAGCDLWLSVLGGLFPNTVRTMIASSQSTSPQAAIAQSERLTPLWDLFARNKGGMRVMATAAAILGYTEANCLPHPLQPLQGEDKQKLEAILTQLSLD